MSHNLSGLCDRSLVSPLPGRQLVASSRPVDQLRAPRRHQATTKLAAQNPRANGSQSSKPEPSSRREPLEVVSRIAACVEMNVSRVCKQGSAVAPAAAAARLFRGFRQADRR